MQPIFLKDKPGLVAILLLCFALPFLFMLSSNLIWQIGRHLPGSVDDTCLALPSGLPLVLLLGLAWTGGFILFRRQLFPMAVAVALANALAIFAFLLLFALTNDVVLYFGLSVLYLHPEEGLTNLFLIRLCLGIASAFGASLLAARYIKYRIPQSTEAATQ